MSFQPGLEDIGEPLHMTTFVVIDLETTGTTPTRAGITEIGAVKTRGGEVIGEFQTLVDPGMDIPPMIVALTGITDAMVATAPRIEEVLPSLLEFMGDAVLVAHNAPFDIGFLKAACRNQGYRWPGNEVVDTVTLARRATTKEEAPNKKLSTLARVFGTRVTPNHRALEDARATSEILHHLLERLARWGITHREDLAALRDPLPEKLRRKASMAQGVPAAPGVYVFRGPQGERLYVGTSKNLRARVKSYFTSSEQRRGIRDMLTLATAVDTYVVATPLEASVLELRLINQYRPRFNRRSSRPERTPWIRLTQERYPRLQLARAPVTNGLSLGPVANGKEARLIMEIVQDALHLRSCHTRLPITPSPLSRSCLSKDLGACAAPCVRGTAAGYESAVESALRVLGGDPEQVVSKTASTIADLASREEFERAAQLRDGLAALVHTSMRSRRLNSLAACNMVAARYRDSAWDIVAISHGVLTGTTRVAHGVWESARTLKGGWESAPVDALTEERELVLGWLDQPGVRLLFVEGEWASPVIGPGIHASWVEARRSDQATVHELAQNRF